MIRYLIFRSSTFLRVTKHPFEADPCGNDFAHVVMIFGHAVMQKYATPKALVCENTGHECQIWPHELREQRVRPDLARVTRIFSYQQLRSCVFTLLYRKQKLCPKLSPAIIARFFRKKKQRYKSIQL